VARNTLWLMCFALLASEASAEPAARYGFVPDDGAHLIGDLWTFVCPKGATVSVTLERATSNDLDPEFEIVDAEGTVLAGGDEEIPCVVSSAACSYQCARQLGVPCGSGNPHSIRVRDNFCNGGSYELSVEAEKNGEALPAKALKLGGGAKRRVPKFLDPAGLLREGPALDDEAVIVE